MRQTELFSVYANEQHEIPNRQQNKPKKGMKPTFQALLVWHVFMLCHQLCHTVCNGEITYDGKSQLVDLSYEFNEDTIYWVTTSPLSMKVTYNGSVDTADASFWRQIEEFSAGTHGGTHMDAPCHFALGRWCVSDIPISKLVAPAVVIDISEEVEDDWTVHFSLHHLTSWEDKHGNIPDGAILFIRTGWSRFWPDKLAYAGTLSKDPNEVKFPSIKPEVAQWLVNNRKIVGIGIDTMSFDIPRSDYPRTHVILEEQNIYGIENVNGNLEHLPATGATVYVMPMKLKGSSGAPCRVFATVPMITNAANCNIHTCSILATAVTIFLTYFLWTSSI